MNFIASRCSWVLQVIYGFERGDLPMFAGQQMDVFINVSEPPQNRGNSFWAAAKK